MRIWQRNLALFFLQKIPNRLSSKTYTFIEIRTKHSLIDFSNENIYLFKRIANIWYENLIISPMFKENHPN